MRTYTLLMTSSYSVRYYDEGIANDDGITGRRGHQFPISEWKEEYHANDLQEVGLLALSAPSPSPSSPDGHCDADNNKADGCSESKDGTGGSGGDSSGDSGSGSGGGTVEVKGEWAYIPIISGNEMRELRGQQVNVYKGFSLPLMVRQLGAAEEPDHGDAAMAESATGDDAEEEEEEEIEVAGDDVT